MQGKVAELLQEKYPRNQVLEDFVIPGSRLSVDFFVPHAGLVVEVDGEQHDSFIPYFHGHQGTSNKFSKQVGRDIKKESWTEVNGYRLVRIKTEEDLKEEFDVQ